MIAARIRSKDRLFGILFAVVLATTLASCKKSKDSTSSSPSHRDKIDACSLITSAEVQSIQDSPIKDAKGSESSDGSFRIAQCFYTAETFNKSVSLALTQSDPASPKARNPRDFWKGTFERFAEGAKEEEGDAQKKRSLEEHEEREGARPPKKIDGIGEAAYWSATRMGGALYVLKNDVFIRVSVGGPESEESKINRCKALAEKALSRL
jgi:hypothetical protein